MSKGSGVGFESTKSGAMPSGLEVQGSREGRLGMPFVLSIPHCSGRIPENIRQAIALTDEAIEDSIDIGTKEIFGSVPAWAVVSASWSRLVVDLNRSALDRGPKGVIAEKDYRGRSIYTAGNFPKGAEIEQRLREYYFPFHNLLKEALSKPGVKGLFDCHSLYGIGPQEAPDRGMHRRDIILGNNGDETGKINPALGNITCPEETLDIMKKAFQSAGFSVDINYPYSGGFIITHYAREFAGEGKFFVQVEINQDLFQASAPRQRAEEKLGYVKARIAGSMEEIARAIIGS